jgi:predicted nucleic-acid-binding Zn-ribbon protein
MPLVDGTMTDEEFDFVVKKLNASWQKRGGRPPCGQCASTNYLIHPSLIGNRSDTVAVLAEHTRMPTIAVYCADCGHVEQFSARVVGVSVRKTSDKSGGSNDA